MPTKKLTERKSGTRKIKKTNLKRLPKKELKLHFYLMSNQRCALKQELSKMKFPDKILDAFFKIPRELFINKEFQPKAYMNTRLPLDFNKFTPKPSILCQMISLLDIRANNKVLEIGTGTGFNSSIISLLCHNITTVENIKELVLEAKKITDILRLRGVIKNNINLVFGDGNRGYVAHAPYDRIIITSKKMKKLPMDIEKQLKEGGILVAPLKNKIRKYVKKNGRLIGSDGKVGDFSSFSSPRVKGVSLNSLPTDYSGKVKKRDLNQLLAHFEIGKQKCDLFSAIKKSGIRSDTLQAFTSIPREMFMPFQYIEKTYNDRPHPIAFDQTISQPSLVCKMIDFLNLKKADTVLEIGTGFGYNGALLSRLCREVVTMDIVIGLVEGAREVYNFLIERGILSNNLLVLHGDGYRGYPKKAPYDKVIVTCGATGEVPKELINQLSPKGGICVIPIKERHPSGSEYLYRYIKNGSNVKEEELMAVRFVPFLERKGLQTKRIR